MAKNSVAGLLTSVDDLFSTQESRDEAKLERVINLSPDEISDFPNHPFKVRMDEEMQQMAESVKEHGVLVPALVREKPGGGYEMVAGHRRKRAAELAELPEIPCIVRNLTDDEAIIVMVDSNLQREKILPSEKAFAYKMRLDAMKRQGQRTDLTSVPLAQKLTSRAELGKVVGESQDQVRRYMKIPRNPSAITLSAMKMASASQRICLTGFTRFTRRWAGPAGNSCPILMCISRRTGRPTGISSTTPTLRAISRSLRWTRKPDSFQLYNPDGSLITQTFTYPEITEIDTFYTNAEGYLITPEPLEYGTGFSLVEVQAPYGYTLSTEPVYFDVTQDASSEEGGVTIIEVVKENVAQKGVIKVSKTGEVFASVTENNSVYQPVYEVQGLSGAVFEITAVEDVYTPDGTLRYSAGEVVDTITTEPDGTAQSKPLYLGKFEIREIEFPYGMTNTGAEPQIMELTYAGQEIEITETSTGFYNERQKVMVTLDSNYRPNRF